MRSASTQYTLLLVCTVAIISNKGFVTAAPNNICRIGRGPHQAFASSRALITSMAHKEASNVEDPSGSVENEKIEVAGQHVEVVGVPGISSTDISKAIKSGPFRQWLDYMKGSSGILTLGGSGGGRCSLRKILIQSIDMFGPRVGFVKFKADIIDLKTGAKLPGIVFARGGAVGILMLLECEGVKYAVLTEQARVPVGRTIMELPAGMLDDDAGDFVGTAAREVEEETGIHIKASDLIDLTGLLDESTGRKMFPSPGGSDEEITLFLYRCHVKKEVIDSLQGQDTGLRDHGELIRVHVVPYDTLWRMSPDSKVLAAIALYETALRLNLLPNSPNAPDLSQF
uniref:Nudix hydrolase domain-containing protein n=3 Tax=Physcomitrium patens TaxID=3218 RepID=A0A7I4F4V7_PHYPA